MTNTQVPHIFDDYELSSSSTPSSMHPSHSPFLFHSSAPYNHSSHHPTDQFYAQAPRPVAQSQVYSQGQAPSSAPELVTIPSQWQLQDLTQYTQHRHSLSLDTDSHSQTSQYSPAPSSALSVTSTSFSYSPFASPTENRAETSSSQCYFGGSAHPESVQPDVAAERRGSDALTYHSQHSSAHDRLTHWYGTNGGSGFGSGLEAQRAKAGSRSRTVPDVERRSIGKGSLSAGSGPAESGSSALNQIAENVGNVADCSKEDMAGVDQQASRWSTLPKQSGMDANSGQVPQYSTTMLPSWYPHEHSQQQLQYQLTPDGRSNITTATATFPGYVHGRGQASASAISSFRGPFDFQTHCTLSVEGSQQSLHDQPNVPMFHANQRVDCDSGELSDDFDGDDFDDNFDDDLDSAPSRLAGQSGGTDAVLMSGSSITGLGAPTSGSSNTLSLAELGGFTLTATPGSSNVATGVGQGHLGLAHRPPSPEAELQFPPGISGTPADFERGLRDTGTLTYEVLADWVNVRKSPAPGVATGSCPGPVASSQLDATSFLSLSDPSASGERPHKMKRAQIETSTLGSGSQAVKVLVESTKPGEPPKRVKMHQCGICQKLFPRPSGLATHMNSHSGARPFKCPLALCPKTFAVRSNARRHLRTHGITIPPPSMRGGRAQDESFQVGFETPVVIDVHDPASPYTAEAELVTQNDEPPSEDGSTSLRRGEVKGRKHSLRWIPQSLADRSNAGRLRSISPGSDMADVDTELGPLPNMNMQNSSDDSTISRPILGSGSSATRNGDLNYSAFDFSHPQDIAPFATLDFGADQAQVEPSQMHKQGLEHGTAHASLRVAPVPLPPALPTDESGASDLYTRFEERNSSSEAGSHPYHPDQWRSLPGPGLVSASCT